MILLPAAATGAAVTLGSRRILAPGRWRWLRALLWLIGLFVLVALAFVLVAGLSLAALMVATGQPMPALGKAVHAPPAMLFATMSLGALAALGAYSGLARLGEDRRPAELALRPAPRELLVGLLLGAAMMAATVFLLWAGGWAILARQPVTAIWSAIGNSVESGIVEETLFRLVIFRLLWRAFGLWAALGLSALLFGAIHLMNPNASPFAALCIALEAGVMLAAFYILTGRLWVSIGVHAGWNFTQGWIFGAAVSGTGGFAGGPLSLAPTPGASPILSGGGFGPEASLAGLAVGTAVGAFALHRAWRAGRFAAVDP
jgi:membrane protease YdiL (CAAX protease family)